jgi:histone H3/H4
MFAQHAGRKIINVDDVILAGMFMEVVLLKRLSVIIL